MESFQYKVICDKQRLYGFDWSMVALFSIAIFTVWFAFHTPDFSFIESLSKEELKQLEIQPWHAVVMVCGASIMLMTLYMLIDHLAIIFELFITVTSSVAVGTVT